jgi:hypothetical protein
MLDSGGYLDWGVGGPGWDGEGSARWDGEGDTGWDGEGGDWGAGHSTVMGTEGTRRPPSVVIAAIDLGFIAPVVPATGRVGQDQEWGCIG